MNRSNVAILLGAVCLLALYGASAEPLRHLKAKGRLSPDQQQPVFASVGETLDLEKRRRAEPGYDAVRGGGDITVTGDGGNVETNNRGFYDPHNHYTGILDYRSIGLMLSFAKYDSTFEDHGSEKRAKGEASILKAKLTQLYKDIAPAIKVANDKLGNQYDVFDPEDKMLYVHQYLSAGFLAGVSLKDDTFEASQSIPSRTAVKPMAVKFEGEDKTKIETALGKLKEFKAVLYQEMFVWGKRFHEQMTTATDKSKSWVGNDAARTTFGSWSHMGLLKCMAEGGIDYTNTAVIKNVLDQSLTASASVDFDTSYSLRGLYEDAAKNTNPQDADAALVQYAKLVVQQLIDSNIRYVELSQPIGKVPFDKTLLGSVSKEVQAVLGASKGYPGSKLWAVFSDDKVKDKIRIRWLPMYFQKRLAHIDGDNFLMQWVKKAKTGEGQEFEAKSMNCAASKGNWVNPDQLAAVKFLLQFDHIVGVDYASPEVGIFDFSTAVGGYNNFEADATALATVCGDKGKRCVMHIHSGEGYPMYNFHAYFKTDVAKALIDNPVDGPARFSKLVDQKDFGMKDFKGFCDNAKLKYQDASKAPLVKVVMIKNAQGKPSQPLHYEGGRRNIEGIIGGLKKLKLVKDDKLQKAWFGTENESPIVLFRLGHATHLTYDMAKEMRQYDLMVDNNYQSNLATGALGWNSYHARASKGFREENVGDLMTLGSDLLKNFAVGAEERDPVFDSKLALYFNGIGLYAAFLAGVQVMPGSDGAGSENSDIHEGYMIAHTLLSNFVTKCDKADAKPYNSVQLTDICAKWWADDKSPIKHDITAQGVLNHLLNYQRFYSRYMFGDDCVKAKEKGSKHKCKLLKPWDTDPTKPRVLRFA